MTQVQAYGGKKQREGNRQRHDDGAAHVAERNQQDQDYQDDAFGQVVQYGVGGEVHEFAAVDEGDQFHARRENVGVQILDLLVDIHERLVGFSALAQQHNSGDYVLIVDDLAVFAPDRSSELSQPDLGALRHHSNVLHTQRRAIFRRNDRAFNVFDVADESYRAHVDLLQALFDEAAAGIQVVAGKLLFDLTDAEAVGHQPVGINPYLVFTGGTSEARHVHDVGHGLEVLLYYPVFERLQFHDVVLRI